METEKAETEKAETEKAETEKAEAEKAETEKAETEKAEAEKMETENRDTPECGCGECKCRKKKKRSEKEYKDLMNRLKRIEGQVRGIQRMLEDDAYCTDVMTQVAAVTAALNSFNRVLLSNHMHTCVAEEIRRGNDEVIEELAVLFQKLMK